jgi:hypothetical protein
VAVVVETLGRYDPADPATLEDVFAIDREARILAEESLKTHWL